MSKQLPVSVLLATEDRDLGLCHGSKAVALATEYANDENVTVRIRDVVTDRVLRVVNPTPVWKKDGCERGRYFARNSRTNELRAFPINFTSADDYDQAAAAAKRERDQFIKQQG
jgi:hypothetical protein